MPGIIAYSQENKLISFFFYGIIFYNAVLQLLKNNKLGRHLLLPLLYFTWKEP